MHGSLEMGLLMQGEGLNWLYVPGMPSIGTYYFDGRKGQRAAMGTPWWQAWVVLPRLKS